tara:strand:- start:1517 stop:1897 length:381 start_codon:yes stop_codon:yes gene_type:complete
VIEVTVKFEIPDGNGEAMSTLMGMVEKSGAEIVHVEGKEEKKRPTVAAMVERQPRRLGTRVENPLIDLKEAMVVLGVKAPETVRKHVKPEEISSPGQKQLFRKSDVIAARAKLGPMAGKGLTRKKK